MPTSLSATACRAKTPTSSSAMAGHATALMLSSSMVNQGITRTSSPTTVDCVTTLSNISPHFTVPTDEPDLKAWYFLIPNVLSIVLLNIQCMLGQRKCKVNGICNTHYNIDFLRCSANNERAPTILCVTKIKRWQDCHFWNIAPRLWRHRPWQKQTREGGAAIALCQRMNCALYPLVLLTLSAVWAN